MIIKIVISTVNVCVPIWHIPDLYIKPFKRSHIPRLSSFTNHYVLIQYLMLWFKASFI